MRLEYRKLSDAEISSGFGELNNWSLENGQIAKVFEFGDYTEGPAFAVEVGKLAEELNHHPDILITWRKVRVSVNTHDVGGISPYDFELARRIEALASR